MVQLKGMLETWMLETFFPTTEDLTTMQVAFTDEVRPHSPVATQILRRKLLGMLQMERMRGPDFAPRIDPTGETVRNRFISLCQRRIDINTATEEELVQRIPGIGDNWARAIRDAIAAKPSQPAVCTPIELDKLLKEIRGSRQMPQITADRALCFLTSYGRREDAPRHSDLFPIATTNPWTCARDERGRFVSMGATSQ
jgi:hypothetical protein